MSVRRISLTAGVGALLVGVPLALAQPEIPKTLTACAALLPAGKVYTVQMQGTIDTRTGTPMFHGKLSVDDGTQVDRSQDDGSVAFSRCVVRTVGAIGN